MPTVQIIYEDEVVLVCNKPAGLMVEPDRNNFPNLLQDVKNYLKAVTKEKLPYAQHLHRLDRPTSGIILFTKKKEYLRNLSEQFARREVSKEYLALSKTAPLQLAGRLEHWHRKEKKKAVIFLTEEAYTEKAILEYKVKQQEKFYLWEIKLQTGKYHQIRVQLASLGCPILGDELYGSTENYKLNAIALHAWKLRIQHPVTKKEMEFEATCNL